MITKAFEIRMTALNIVAITLEFSRSKNGEKEKEENFFSAKRSREWREGRVRPNEI